MKSSPAPQRWSKALLSSLLFLSSFQIQKFVTQKSLLKKLVLRKFAAKTLVGRGRKIDRRGDWSTYRWTTGSRRCRGNNQIQIVRDVSVIAAVHLYGLRCSTQR